MPTDHEDYNGDKYSQYGHLRLTCADCDKDLACYTTDPFVCVRCPECEDKSESA